MNTQAWSDLEAITRQGKLAPKFEGAVSVAILAGPSIVIEAVVYKASQDSGIEMDWGYMGGRAVVYSFGDYDKAREALKFAMPVGNLD